jgi:hypothetical protein
MIYLVDLQIYTSIPEKMKELKTILTQSLVYPPLAEASLVRLDPPIYKS